MARYQLSTPALKDIVEILTYTEEHFGRVQRTRYETLLFTALTDLANDPEQLGSRLQAELGVGVRLYHVRHSRDRARTRSGRVTAPRHLVVYRHKVPGIVGIGRILHDAMDIERHRPDTFGDEV